VKSGTEGATAQFNARADLSPRAASEPALEPRSSYPNDPIPGVDADGESVVMVRPVTLVDDAEASGDPFPVQPPHASETAPHDAALSREPVSRTLDNTRQSKPPPPRPTDARELTQEFIEEVEPESEPPTEAREPSMPDVEVEVEVELDTTAPVPSKRPPPPPLKPRPVEGAPNGAATAAAPLPPPARAPQLSQPEASTTRRQKPWWEELFSDDFIRTMDRLSPKIVRRDVDFIEDSLGVEQGAVILDLACGGGEHAVELASRGYSVVGHDLSLTMLARAGDEAQERSQKLNFLHGDMRELAFDSTFDAVYCWDTSFGYFDEERNADVLARIHRALRPGGMLLLDLANRDYIASRSPSVVWFEGDGCRCMDDMHVDFFTSRLTVKRTVMFDDGRARELDYSIRLYALHELGKLLHDLGFKVVEVTGHQAHKGVYFGAESPRVIILAERD
jgi:SAM-dependent methyltransferase